MSIFTDGYCSGGDEMRLESPMDFEYSQTGEGATVPFTTADFEEPSAAPDSDAMVLAEDSLPVRPKRQPRALAIRTGPTKRVAKLAKPLISPILPEITRPLPFGAPPVWAEVNLGSPFVRSELIVFAGSSGAL